VRICPGERSKECIDVQNANEYEVIDSFQDVVVGKIYGKSLEEMKPIYIYVKQKRNG